MKPCFTTSNSQYCLEYNPHPKPQWFFMTCGANFGFTPVPTQTKPGVKMDGFDSSRCCSHHRWFIGSCVLLSKFHSVFLNQHVFRELVSAFCNVVCSCRQDYLLFVSCILRREQERKSYKLVIADN
uniref:Uncharacterized protein n=1 Tax=Arundo donax TaxID=35708 RepID=A0A0A9HGA9_ARUDO